MAIGLGALRAAGRGRSGRAEEGKEPARSTVREVCLIGLDRRGSDKDWTTGQEVTWLGRRYQVAGTALEVPERGLAGHAGRHVAPARQYVHLARCDGG